VAFLDLYINLLINGKRKTAGIYPAVFHPRSLIY